MEKPVRFVWSLKSSILSSTRLQMDNTFRGVVSATVEQSRRKSKMVARGDWKFGPWGWPLYPSKPKKIYTEYFRFHLIYTIWTWLEALILRLCIKGIFIIHEFGIVITQFGLPLTAPSATILLPAVSGAEPGSNFLKKQLLIGATEKGPSQRK